MTRSLFATLASLALAACATNPIDEGKALIAAGKIEEGLAILEAARESSATDARIRSQYPRAIESIIARLNAEAELAQSRGDADTAEARYRRVLRLDPSNPRALQGVAQIEQGRVHARLVRSADEALKKGDNAAAEALVRQVLAENSGNRAARAIQRRINEAQPPTPPAGSALKVALGRSVSMEFRETPLRAIFELLSRTAGINFVFDREVRQDNRTSIFVRNVSIDDVLKVVLTTNQLERKILGDNTILVYPNNPAKLREYQDLVVRTFYLANADPKQTLNLLRTVLKAKDVFVDEKLNQIVMRDTPDMIRLAERLLVSHDLPEAEVVLELEVLEVGASTASELGVRFPEAVSYGIPGTAATAGGTITFPVADTLRFAVANPAAIVNLKNRLGDTNLLANPRIRIRNRDKARILIGEKVPVFTSTATANVGVSSSVTYLDVGLKVELEPNVYLEDEVGMKVNLEVSNILETVQTGDTRNPTIAYRLGTRNATTSLRLRDGETQVLAGLIRDEDRRDVARVPVLGEVPILGRLFGNQTRNRQKSEIVLLITPRVVRNVERPDHAPLEIYSGTEAMPAAAPLRIDSARGASLAVTPQSGTGAGPAGLPSAGSVPGLPPLGGPSALPPITPGLTSPAPPSAPRPPPGASPGAAAPPPPPPAAPPPPAPPPAVGGTVTGTTITPLTLPLVIPPPPAR